MADNKDEVKVAPEDAIAKAVREAVGKALSEAIPAVATIAVESQRKANQVVGDGKAEAAIRAAAQRLQCPKCFQPVSACNGKHRRVVVYPTNQRFGRYFQGVFINGIRYLSNGPSHAIDVPLECDIEYMISAWEQNEYDTAQGRKAEHNSGSLGAAGGQFSPATEGWR